MKRIYVIAKNTFREVYRDRFFMVILLLAIGLFLLSFVLGTLSFAEQLRILFNMGLTAIHIVMLGLAIFMGSFSVSRELERQTFTTVLARPISRSEFIVGKALGVFLVLLLSLVSLGLLLYLILPGTVPSVVFSKIIFGILCEGAILLVMAQFFSLLLRPNVAVFGTFSIFLMGHWLEELAYFAKKSESGAYQIFAKSMKVIIPNLQDLNWRSFHLLDEGIKNESLLWALAHTVGWVGILLVLTQMVFKRRNFV